MINSVNFQGRLVRDIELKYTDSQVAHTEFTVAWSEKYKEAETKCFLRCKAWRQTAEFLSKYFAKGQEIAISGRLVTEEWEKDGEKQSRTICMVDKAHFCGSKLSDSEKTANNSGNDFMSIPDGIDEELPFN
jgi:single-strand DNA-binding protein